MKRQRHKRPRVALRQRRARRHPKRGIWQRKSKHSPTLHRRQWMTSTAVGIVTLVAASYLMIIALNRLMQELSDAMLLNGELFDEEAFDEGILA